MSEVELTNFPQVSGAAILGALFHSHDALKNGQLVAYDDLVAILSESLGLSGVFGLVQAVSDVENWCISHEDGLKHDDRYYTESEVDTLLSAVSSAVVGEIRLFAGASAPDKWLVCDGHAISRVS